MLVASIIPTVMVGWVSVSHTRELLVRDAQELAQEHVKQLRLKLGELLSEPTQPVLALANTAFFSRTPSSDASMRSSSAPDTTLCSSATRTSAIRPENGA